MSLSVLKTFTMKIFIMLRIQAIMFDNSDANLNWQPLQHSHQ